MVANFQQGPDYSTVHYDEYVLINTENKNDKDNGKLYRRGYDYTNNLGGAIYIGSIVGPAGKAPMLELTTIADVKEKSTGEGDERFGEGSYTPIVDLVPGKNIDGTFNDAIEWAYCSVRDKNGEDTIAYIGFKFPYTVIDYEGEKVTPYYTENFTERIDEKNHPFYEKWKIYIPQGIKGDTLKNFRIVEADDTINYQNSNLDKKQDDINNKRKVLVYDYYNYDEKEEGDATTFYLGDYNMIENVQLSENGIITISYTHDGKQELSQLLRWIKEISLDEKGHFKIIYNNIDENGENIFYSQNLKWLNTIDIGDNGIITCTYNDGTTSSLEKTVKWIKSVYFNNNGDNKIHIVYNNSVDESIDQVIKIVEKIYVDENDYLFHVKYNTGTEIISSDPMNYIAETAIYNNYLLIYYTNANIRQELKNLGLTINYNNKDWFKVGSVKDDGGILIGLNIIPNNNITDISSAIEYLNNNYSGGLSDGKIITIGASDENKEFYAFDYDKNSWYYLGTFENDNYWTIIGNEDDIDIEVKKNKLATNGIWFVTENRND
jgi:hypothetical protein